MSRLAWGAAGDKKYTLGVNKGVLYIPTNGVYSLGVVWNGLSSVTESPSGADEQKFYADNMQYASIRGAEDFGGTIECYAYPDEFGVCNGEVEIAPGVRGNQQDRKPFGFSYVSQIGNDTEGQAYGYELHLVYNATASPTEKQHQTINDSPSPDSMSFSFSCNPTATKFTPKPLSHIIINSTTVDPVKLRTFEDILYGKDATVVDGQETEAGTLARLPLPNEVYDHFNAA